MPGLKIFFAWLLTVVIGSILLPFGVLIWNGMGIESSDIGFGLFFVLVAVIISGLSSLLTLITLLIVNGLNVQKPLKVQFKYMNMTHLIMFLLTLVVGNILLFFDSYNPDYPEVTKRIIWEEMVPLTCVIILYAITAVPIWILFFRKLWIESREEETREGSADGQA